MRGISDYHEAGRLPPRNETERMRQELPYGVWTCADGTEVLFNRRYQPIWRRTPGGAVKPTKRDEWIDRIADQKWIFGDGDPPWRSPESRRRCEKVLDDFKRGRPLVGMQSD
jgi:hypothetical protein